VDPTTILKQYFGYDSFREGQLELVNALASKKDVLAIMPTGAGKSLCFQIPAMMLPGTTLVVSPLISLMRDQIQALAACGIPAAFINSSLQDGEIRQTFSNAYKGLYKIIYIAPERLLTPSMLRLAASLDISFIAVDVAHCVSHWGPDFRKSYLDIPKFVDCLQARPVIGAFTATATPWVRDDMLKNLKLKKPLVKVTGFDRPNLYFEVLEPKDKNYTLRQYLKENGGNGIVYCSTRKQVEKVTDMLLSNGFSAVRYHAGLTRNERIESQDDFLNDKARVIVATNAFGMGIDKSNVRFVIHYNLPMSVESYFQEAGRAGRDGLPSDCILYFAKNDINIARFLINKSYNKIEIARNMKLLDQMVGYFNTKGCLRKYMLNYFGEQPPESCSGCANCARSVGKKYLSTDASEILSHIMLLNNMGKQLAFSQACDILLGKSEAYFELPTYDSMRGYASRYIQQLVMCLKEAGYLKNTAKLALTQKAVKELNFQVVQKPDGATTRSATSKGKVDLHKYLFSEELFTKLQSLRHVIANEENVHPHNIFSDATLVDMCYKHPYSDVEFLSVKGVGEFKLKQYGARFLGLLAQEERMAQGKACAFTYGFLHKHMKVEETPVQILGVVNNINAVLAKFNQPRTSSQRLSSLLVDAGYLRQSQGALMPTFGGQKIGIAPNANTQMFDPAAQEVCLELAVEDLNNQLSTQ